MRKIIAALQVSLDGLIEGPNEELDWVDWVYAGLVFQLACGAPSEQSPSRPPVDAVLAQLGDAFVSRTANVNGTTLHYVRGGAGPAVILLHGFPQDWSVFRRIMPRLARTFTVVAVDLRGIGGSTPAANAYDAPTLGVDIQLLAMHIGLEKPYVAGHDNGGMVAYALARLYPQATRGVMILDVPIPGLDPWEQVKADPALWHFGFHQTPRAPEGLIAGREAIYFREVFFNRLARNPGAISDDDLAHYVRSYASPEQLRAGLEFYRAYPENARFNAARREPIDVPIVLAGGEHSLAPLNATVAESLRNHGWRNLSIEVIANSGHQVIDEQPAAVAELLNDTRHDQADDNGLHRMNIDYHEWRGKAHQPGHAHMVKRRHHLYWRTYKSVVKLTFAKGASLKDPAPLFNSSLDGNVRRAIDIHEGETVDESAFMAFVRQAVALNKSGKSRT